mgnify:CR=1 FL=1
MGIFGAAKKGFGMLGKKSGTIKSIKPAKNLSTKRSIQDKVVAAIDKGTKEGLKGATPSPHLKQLSSKTKRDSSKKLKSISYDYDKLVSDRHKANKKLLRKTVGGAGAALTGVVGAHVGAKRKWPKYKKFMERNITIKDGKVKLVPYKKK